MDISGFKVEEFLPYYLTADQKQGLAKAFVGFTDKSHLYTAKFADQFLQGDCCEGVPYYDYGAGKLADVKAILLSNSCDIDPENSRDFPVQITFVPLMSLAKYEKALGYVDGLSPAAITAKIQAIRGQQITSLIYFPAGTVLKEDCIAPLDRVASMPYQMVAAGKPAKLFALNQLGHYLLSFKLSVHFCRLHEGIVRGI